MLGVIRQQRSLADKLNPALDLKFWLSRGYATTMKFGSHSCGEEREKNKLIIWFLKDKNNSEKTNHNVVKESQNLPKSCWQKASRTVFIAGASSTEGQFWQAGLGKSVITNKIFNKTVGDIQFI